MASYRSVFPVMRSTLLVFDAMNGRTFNVVEGLAHCHHHFFRF